MVTYKFVTGDKNIFRYFEESNTLGGQTLGVKNQLFTQEKNIKETNKTRMMLATVKFQQ